MLSKKYYKAFAEVVQEVRRHGVDERTLGLFARELADLFGSDNHRFDRNRFMEAAGINLGSPYPVAKS